MKNGELSPNDRGLLLCMTGNGKGKSTAAFGTVLRALGWGQQVAVIQMVKGSRETGEWQFFRRFHPEVFFEIGGVGFTTTAGDHASAAQKTWKLCRKMLREFPGDLLVIDELNIALSLNFLEEEAVLADLADRRPGLNVIVTGRNAPESLRNAADLVSEVMEVKHPYRQGIPARKGVDY